ncbi:Gfo/Idh/MocA family protein [Streptomyces rimosus]|uniref:Gfo/Idh/MocA family protein n=1 Tax=Streptomyces rimosus TaxID=1927 RepID=UPI0004C05954|nr:Gfo/Idh/MocA family oxidoreductase [Streptomyces rimosus]
MRRVRLGVLGCASIARRRTLPAVLRVQELELAAVASRDRARGEAFATEFGCRAVAGYRRLIDRDDIDAVYVPLPTGLHHTWVERALRAGKHVLAEKPLTDDHAATARLAGLARERGLLLRENFAFLHHAQHWAVRELVSAGEIGDIRSFRAVFGIPPRAANDVRYQCELGGGALLDVGVYPLRAAQLLVSDELEVVGARLRKDRTSGVDIGGSALLVTASGSTAQVEFGFDRHYRGAYELWGSEGRIVVERAYTPPASLAPSVRVERPDGVRHLDMPADDQFRNVTAAFARDVLAGACVDDAAAAGGINTADAIVRQAAVVAAVRRAAQSHTPA